MALHTSKKGLDLPLAGAPALQLEAAPAVSRVALLGADYVGLKPALLVEPGARVQRGQPVIADKSNPGVQLTAPAGGLVAELHRGERRAFVALLIGIAVAAMALGVIFKRPCLRGSCGGPKVFGPDGEPISCATCPNRDAH